MNPPKNAMEKADLALHLLTQIDARIYHAVETIIADNARDTYRRVDKNAIVDGTGTAVMEFHLRLGHGWELATIATTGAVGGGILVYLNAQTPGNLVRVMAGTTFQSDDFMEGEYVPEGGHVIVVMTGQTVGNTVTAAMRVKVLDTSQPIVISGVGEDM